MRSKTRLILSSIIGIVILVTTLLKWGTGLYTDWLWFKSLQYQQVFITIILSKIGLRTAVGIIFFAFLFINLFMVRKPVLQAINNRQTQENDDIITLYQSPVANFLTPKRFTFLIAAISILVAFFYSYSVTGDWITLQNFLHPSSFNTADPIFKKDVGFYVFSLPFYNLLYLLLTRAILITAFFIALIYLISDSSPGRITKILRSAGARYHLSILAAVYFIIKAWGYRLNQYMLLFSGGGVVHGAGYTDIHANLVGLKILTVLSLIAAAAILINLFMQKFRLVLYSIGFLIVSSVLLNGIYPTIIQNFIVKPNEYNKEAQYIKYNIAFTNQAYKLQEIERKPFPAGKTLSATDIQNNRDVIDNIRLWDWRPLQETYSQLQEMRPYYKLKNIDIDRYIIDGQYRQVMLAARELEQEQLNNQAKTWVNQRLIYTHGYGVAMSPVNEVTTEGLPQFFIKDIPPVTQVDGPEIKRPEIYYGESEDNYVIVNTKTQEFDHPKGENNVYTTYEEKSGVKVGSIIRRLMFALNFADYKLLLSSDITNDSQILYYRNIQDRVTRIAPFLSYDNDPYLVVSDNKLYWMWDAYTTSNMYPYSEPFSGSNNYIRNAVKVIIDAYNGNVSFYISDPSDPLINTYSKIFPDMFSSMDKMPAGLLDHIRYPVDMFMIQADKYALYHMNNPQVFYNKEDKWNLPTELFGNEEENMEAYYTITRLPGEDNPEYTLIMPFTPQNKKNMIAWMTARSDKENYGRLLVFEFPKQELVYGPMQIESRINQDTTISQQLTLWNQRGSSVIRGNLLVIPIKDALIYVEPLYLQAEQSKMPELRRVIVALGDKVVMEPNLNLALQAIFGTAQKPSTIDQPDQPTEDVSIAELITKANNLYNDAQSKLKEGDWTGYGESIKQLKDVLNTLNEMAGK